MVDLCCHATFFLEALCDDPQNGYEEDRPHPLPPKKYIVYQFSLTQSSTLPWMVFLMGSFRTSCVFSLRGNEIHGIEIKTVYQACKISDLITDIFYWRGLFSYPRGLTNILCTYYVFMVVSITPYKRKILDLVTKQTFTINGNNLIQETRQPPPMPAPSEILNVNKEVETHFN